MATTIIFPIFIPVLGGLWCGGITKLVRVEDETRDSSKVDVSRFITEDELSSALAQGEMRVAVDETHQERLRELNDLVFGQVSVFIFVVLLLVLSLDIHRR